MLYCIYFPLLPLLISLLFHLNDYMQPALCSFRHHIIKKWIYGVVIATIWLITTSRESVQVVFVETENLSMFISTTLYFPYYLIFIFLICFSYILIFIEVRRSPRPQHHSAAGWSERKLTGTLFVVTLASLLSMLPAIIYLCMTIFLFTVNLKPFLTVTLSF